jgi:hypothetical protein
MASILVSSAWGTTQGDMPPHRLLAWMNLQWRRVWNAYERYIKRNQGHSLSAFACSSPQWRWKQIIVKYSDPIQGKINPRFSHKRVLSHLQNSSRIEISFIVCSEARKSTWVLGGLWYHSFKSSAYSCWCWKVEEEGWDRKFGLLIRVTCSYPIQHWKFPSWPIPKCGDISMLSGTNKLQIFTLLYM